MGRTSPYHTNSPEDHPVYHNRDDCRDGNAIEGGHYVSGPGENRSLCAECRRLGCGRYGRYAAWLDESLSAASARAGRAAKEERQRNDEFEARKAEDRRLRAARKKLSDEREKLKAKARTKEEEARYQEIPHENTRLYEAQTANQQLIYRAQEEVTKHEGEAARASNAVDQRLELQKEIIATLDSVAVDCEPEDASLLADVVMNEARAQSPAAKRAVSYAYLNLKGGKVAAPKGKEISNFMPAEARFAEAKDEAERLAYVRQVKDSLAAAVARLRDASADTSDPTRGATNWVSPQSLSKTQKKAYATLSGKDFSHLKNMEKVVVPGVPAKVFTFYRPRKKQPRAAKAHPARARSAAPPAGVAAH